MKTCPRCGRYMIEKRGSIVYLSYPAQYDLMWWCGCGHQEYAGRVFGKTEQQLCQEEWDKINRSYN